MFWKIVRVGLILCLLSIMSTGLIFLIELIKNGGIFYFAQVIVSTCGVWFLIYGLKDIWDIENRDVEKELGIWKEKLEIK